MNDSCEQPATASDHGPEIERRLDELGFCPECHRLVALVRVRKVWPDGFFLAGQMYDATQVETHVGADGDRCRSWERPAVLLVGPTWISWTLGRHGLQ